LFDRFCDASHKVTSRGLELVHNGNERSALFTLRTAREMGDLHRVILGTDAPPAPACNRSAFCAWSRCCHRYYGDSALNYLASFVHCHRNSS
jgi:hypothetical protein